MNARVFAAILALCAVVLVAHADHLRVSRPAIVRAERSSSAAEVARHVAGDTLVLLEPDQVDGWYRVRSASRAGDGASRGGSSRDGWIYRNFVRRIPGDPPRSGTDAPEPPSDDSRPSDAAPSASDVWRLRHSSIAGAPVAIHVVAREGYMAAVDGRLGVPAWVQYVLTPADLAGEASRDGKRFREDPRVAEVVRVRDQDYVGSGYERGHMAPAEDMVRSEAVMVESFLTSNAVPQHGPGFNGAIWASLEKAIRGWVRARGPLVIITGPIFEPTTTAPAVPGKRHTGSLQIPLIGEAGVAVPSHLYKIVVDVRVPDAPEALAFVLPNTSLSGRRFSEAEFVVSIDEIERRTGVDFLPDLPDDIETRLEAAKATAVWPEQP